ncbi:response regulator transcription factor [Litorisediminicola beolgyonensis]|uniref:Response regulator transcription factor n=1 Tax=Litorisediminicola beolgyonensis TaxID=1173614 RepID=A0ABW3ZHS8_9RHOB
MTIGQAFPDAPLLRVDDGTRPADTGAIRVVLVAPGVSRDEQSLREDLDLTSTKVIFAHCYDDESDLDALFETRFTNGASAGASFLPMAIRTDVWISLLKLFLLGQPYIPAEAICRLGLSTPETGRPSPDAAIREKLTAREFEVLSLAAHGRQNKIIADALDLSEHTVKLHMHHIIKKLGVRNRTEAARLLMAPGR